MEKIVDINVARLSKNEDGEYVAFNTDDLDHNGDLNRLVFLFEHRDGKVVINLDDVLRCLKIAEENHYIPEADEKWWNIIEGFIAEKWR